jgi:heat shock protein HslJ
MLNKNEVAFHLPLLLIILLIGGATVGCGSEEEEAVESTAIESSVEESPVISNNPLANTSWRLAEIQSMDDATGTTRPDDPAKYTMRLNSDGTVNMVLNCNRANGSYTIEPSSDPSNGRFEFGPLAMTRALCPPPSLDGEIAAQAQWIRGYLLKDGNLYLSLMADGGIYAWEPDNDLSF